MADTVKGVEIDPVREKLVELLENDYCPLLYVLGDSVGTLADYLIAHGVTVQERARPLEEWGEDYGDVLWWRFPIEEPPYVGSPLDVNWPAYHTHWTTIPMPQTPKGDEPCQDYSSRTTPPVTSMSMVRTSTTL